MFWAGIWLFYLAYPLLEGWRRRDTVAGWLGIALLAVFVVLYLSVFARHRRRDLLSAAVRQTARRGIAEVVVLAALTVAICACIGQAGTVCAVYLAVVAMFVFPSAVGWPVAVVAGVGAYLATIVIPGWDHDPSILFGVLVASLAVWGVRTAIARNAALFTARQENARLAVANERNRFSRDLHDILGHSLTVITVKAELAGRLIDVDPERAREEIADLENLSRSALGDVRRAVEGYREMTLGHELARARGALEAAQIRAVVPPVADEVDGDLQELFAWSVREGVTNVIRHSGARRCEIALGMNRVAISDDGHGRADGDADHGHGLLGLRERAASHGAVVVTTSDESGFVLEVVARAAAVPGRPR